MLNPKYVLENAEVIIKKTKARGLDISLNDFKKLSQAKKNHLTKTENLRFERNKASQRVAQMKREGKDASKLKASMKEKMVFRSNRGMKDKPIGIFDSGLGGLSVFKVI